MAPDLSMSRPCPTRRRVGAAPALLCCAFLAACALTPEPGAGTAANGAPPAPAAAPVPAHPETRAPAATHTATPSAPTTASPTPASSPATARAPGAEPVCAGPAGCFGQPRRVGSFDVGAVPEASGLVASQRNPGILWLLDDRPGTSEVWALRTSGGLLGPVPVQGLDARDTEALAVGPCEPWQETSCLFIGDIGDNLRARDHVTIHRIVEPDLSAGLPTEPVPATVARLTYPPLGEGQPQAHDAEALLAGPDGSLLIVTKAPFDRATGTTGEAHLFVADRFGDGVLVDHGVVGVPAPALPLHSLLVGNVVTGGDARDGQVLLRTYDQVLLYLAPRPDADLRAFASWPVHPLPSAIEPQSEAIAWARDGCGYFTAGEQVGDLWFVPCLP